jgi:hypothetical protein
VLEEGANAVAVERADARMDNFMVDLLDIFFMICDDVVFLPSGSIDRGIRHTTGMMCSHLLSMTDMRYYRFKFGHGIIYKKELR